MASKCCCFKEEFRYFGMILLNIYYGYGSTDAKQEQLFHPQAMPFQNRAYDLIGHKIHKNNRVGKKCSSLQSSS